MSLVVLTPVLAFAQNLNFDVLKTNLTDFKGLLDVLTTVIVALALVFFFWGLAKFVLAAGEEEAREEGKKIMIWGIIAFVIMIGIWGIVKFLLSIFTDSTAAPTIPNVPTR